MELNKVLMSRYYNKPEVKEYILIILEHLSMQRLGAARSSLVSLVEGLESKEYIASLKKDTNAK